MISIEGEIRTRQYIDQQDKKTLCDRSPRIVI